MFDNPLEDLVDSVQGSIDAMQFLKEWDGLLSQSDFFMNILRQLGWLLVKGFKVLVDMCETLLDSAYKLVDFTQFAGVKGFFSNFYTQALLGILCAFALLCVGYMLIVYNGEKKPKVFQNVITFVIIVTLLPTFFSWFNEILLAGNSAVNNLQLDGSSADVKLSDQIIVNGVIDFQYMDSVGFSNYSVVNNAIVTSGEDIRKNGFTGDNISNISYIDVIDVIEEDEMSSETFKYELYTDDAGYTKIKKIEKGKWFWEDTPYYYRYNINFLSIYIGLIATGIALIFTSYKTTKLLWELAVHQFLATLFSATDFINGQKTKKVLKSIASTYVVLFLITVILKFYIIAQNYLTTLGFNPIIESLLLIFLSFAVIDGPNIVERTLGIDAGISSGFRTMHSLFHGARAVGSAAKGIGKATKGVGKATGATMRTATNSLAGSAGMVAGVKEGLKNRPSNNGTSNNPNTVNNNAKNSSNTNSGQLNNAQSMNNNVQSSNSNLDNNRSDNQNSGTEQLHNAQTMNSDTQSSNSNLDSNPSNGTEQLHNAQTMNSDTQSSNSNLDSNPSNGTEQLHNAQTMNSDTQSSNSNNLDNNRSDNQNSGTEQLHNAQTMNNNGKNNDDISQNKHGLNKNNNLNSSPRRDFNSEKSNKNLNPSINREIQTKGMINGAKTSYYKGKDLGNKTVGLARKSVAYTKGFFNKKGKGENK